LSVLEEAERIAQETHPDFDVNALPLDDAATFAMLSRAETVGVFQMESAGMRDVLRKLKPDRFEDIIAVVALYRPGPMENIPRYIACKHGREQPDYPHPSLEPILKETFGIMIYQEQVMQTAQILAGYSLGGADLLRRAMGKKIKAEMDAQRKTFVDGAVAEGVDGAQASAIFDQVAKFAGYGFNKSHAAAYALVAYQTAYMKANHSAAFLAASMTFDMQNTDKLAVFKAEIERSGLAIRPPDVNASRVDFAVERDGETPAIRYALGAIKNVGEAAMAGLVADRADNGRFSSLGDFAARVDPSAVNRRTVENLACAGAFDGLEPNRRRVFDAAEMIARSAAVSAESRAAGQGGLFEAVDDGPMLPLGDAEDWKPDEKLARENAAVGFYLSAHPLDAYQAVLTRLNVKRWRDLPGVLKAGGGAAVGRDGGASVKLAGVMTAKRERVSQNGNRYAFVQFSDQSGQFEATLFSETLNGSRELLESGAAVVLSCSAQQEEESIRLVAQRIVGLEEEASRGGAGLKIFIDRADALGPLKDRLADDKPGQGRIEITLMCDALKDGEPGEVDIALDGGWRLGAEVRKAIKATAGVVDVHELG
ncbi:MAG: DNA polymerase III subunit alpha, partial [Pseudomonadota bacterium]